MRWKIYAEYNKVLHWTGKLVQSNLPRESAISYQIRQYEENKLSIKKAKGEIAEKQYIAQMSVFQLIDLGTYDDKELTFKIHETPVPIFDYEKYEQDIKGKDFKKCQEPEKECQEEHPEEISEEM